MQWQYVHSQALTVFAVVDDEITLGRAAYELGLPPSLVSSPKGSVASIGTDKGQTFKPDAVGLYTVRFGTKGAHGWTDVTFYAGPRSVETHSAYKTTFHGEHTGRKVMASVFAHTPLGQMDLANVVDAHPWPLIRNTVTGEMSGPDFGHHGG